MPWSPDKIPVWLRRTPEQRAGDLALQDRLRQAQGPGRRPNPTESHLLRAAAVKRSALAHLEEQRHSKNPDPLHVESAESQMADALAMEGNYSEAAALHPKAEHADRFRAIAQAIDRDDAEPTCDCPIERQENPATGQPMVVTPDLVSEMIFSSKHQRLMPLLVCSKCQGMQVRAAPAHLEERTRRVREEHQRAKKENRK